MGAVPPKQERAAGRRFRLTTVVRLGHLIRRAPPGATPAGATPFGSPLLGLPGEDVDRLAARMRLLLPLWLVAGNLLGAAAVFALSFVLLPTIEPVDPGEVVRLNLLVGVMFVDRKSVV